MRLGPMDFFRCLLFYLAREGGGSCVVIVFLFRVCISHIFCVQPFCARCVYWHLHEHMLDGELGDLVWIVCCYLHCVGCVVGLFYGGCVVVVVVVFALLFLSFLCGCVSTPAALCCCFVSLFLFCIICVVYNVQDYAHNRGHTTAMHAHNHAHAPTRTKCNGHDLDHGHVTACHDHMHVNEHDLTIRVVHRFFSDASR